MYREEVDGACAAGGETSGGTAVMETDGVDTGMTTTGCCMGGG